MSVELPFAHAVMDLRRHAAINHRCAGPLRTETEPCVRVLGLPFGVEKHALPDNVRNCFKGELPDLVLLTEPNSAALLARSLHQGVSAIAPNALSDWKDLKGRAALAAGLLRFYDRLREAAPSIAIDAAVNPIFAGMTVSEENAQAENFLHAIARRISSLSIMAYRSDVVRALAWAGPAIAQTSAAARPWRMGVLVNEDRSEPGTSWFGTRRDVFESAMRDLNARIAARFSTLDYRGSPVSGL